MEQLGLIKVNHNHFVNVICLRNIFEKYNLVFDDELIINVRLGVYDDV